MCCFQVKKREQSLFSFPPLSYQLSPILGVKISSILDSKSKKGGVSPHTGGQDKRPPQQSSELIGRWVPQSVVRRDADSSNERHDQIFRHVRGILNKLTPEKFDKLSLELLNVGIDSQVILTGVILLIFEKALEEPKYSKLYAQLCLRLCEDVPNFEPSSTSISSFRRLLLNKCQDEFQNRSRATEAYDKKDGPLTSEEKEHYRVAKDKMLGNIKFIGELGKLDMLHQGILHKCIQQLLEKKKNTPLRDMAEDLECLCQIIRTVGPSLDTPKAKTWVNQYFSRIEMYAECEELPSRIRFMLQDVIELRENKWKPRKVASENGPKTITAIRREAANGRGGKVMPSHAQMNGLGQSWKNFGDIFNMPVTNMSNAIGMGPGVIQMDSFAPQYMAGGGGGGGGGRGAPGGGGGMMGNNRGNQQHNPGFQNNNNFHRNKESNGSGSPQNQRHNLQNQQFSNPQHNHQQHNRQAGGQRDNIPPRFQRMAQQQQQHHQQQPPPPQQQQQQQQQMPQGGKPPGRQTPPLSMGGAPPGALSNPMVSVPPSHSGGGGLLSSKEELSLRPQKFMFKPHSPSMLPRSAQAAPSMPLSAQSHGPLLSMPPKRMMVDVANPPINNPIMTKPPVITIKPKEEKPKPPKKETITEEELKEKLPDILNEFFTKQDVAATVSVVKELKIPKKMMPDFLAQFLIGSISRTESEQDGVIKLVATLKADKVVSSEQFIGSFQSVADQMSTLEQERPLVKSHVARFGAQALVQDVVCLSQLAQPFHQGVHYPLFLLCMQAAHRLKDKPWLARAFADSKMDLLTMLPETHQRKERMLEILDDRGLSFLFPLMRVQSELGGQIAAEPSANAIFKWVKERVGPELFTNPKFINILVTSVVKYITGESTLAENTDPTVTPEKALSDKEKELLDKLKGVLQKFLNEHSDLQVAALYAVQVFCHSHQFPKGMLLRFFVNLYDQEIIEEESFLLWKEEVNDEFPGKGKALFQVNQWLTWLEQAEEESEEEDDEE